MPDSVLSQLDMDKIVNQHEHEIMEKCDVPDQVLSQLDVDKLMKESGLFTNRQCEQDGGTSF